jgi:hypothetical protein
MWISSKFAKAGRVLKVKRRNGEWDDGWKVKETYSRFDDPALTSGLRIYDVQ